MTEEETTSCSWEQLKLAREQAIDYKNMKQISAIFEIYKPNANSISMSMVATGGRCSKIT